MKLIYEELTSKLRRIIFDVHNELGVGYDEETYHQGLIRRLQKEDIPHVSKERRWLFHRDIPVRRFELDLLTFDKIILLLKCFQHDFIQQNHVQMISELKLWERN
jgi:GxxExxY protein